jgi:uncharacterized protein DUF2188
VGARGRQQHPLHHRTQDEAISQGRQLAEKKHGELVIHAQGGEIREKDSHGNDPRDIPG